jgi:hypothetical protein
MKKSKIGLANIRARQDIERRAQATPEPVAEPAVPNLRIIDYINTVHDGLDVLAVHNFANKAMSSGGQLTYLYPWEGFDEGVALIYQGEPANMETLKKAFVQLYFKEGV